MGRKRKLVFFLFLGLTLRGADLYSAGRNSLSFLQIVPGARASGLGEAFTGVAKGPETLAFNPAGLAKVNKRQVSLLHTFFVDGVLYDNLIYTHPVSAGAWAVQVGFLTVKGIKKTVADSSIPDGFRELEDISTNDFFASVYYARPVFANLSLGAGLKLVRESLSDTSSTAAALDMGGLYRSKNLPLDIGFSLQHIGPKTKFSDESFSLPYTLRTGLAISREKTFNPKWIPEDSLFSLDVSRTLNGGDQTASAGIEVPIQDKKFTFRSGYKYPLKKQNLGHKFSIPNGFAFGFGINFSGWSADYSATSFGELGLAHRLSLSLGIGHD